MNEQLADYDGVLATELTLNKFARMMNLKQSSL